jgi:hypothetical protein
MESIGTIEDSTAACWGNQNSTRVGDIPFSVKDVAHKA